MRRLIQDDRALGLIGMVLAVVGGLILLLAVTGAVLYANDFAIEATVVDKECGGNPLGSSSEVTVRTELFGIEHMLEDFDNTQCSALRDGDDGNHAVYHIRSGRTILYEREGGSCIYDSAKGLGC